MSTQTGPPRSAATAAASESAGEVQAKAQEAAGRAQEQAQAVAGQAQDRLREQVDQRSTQAGEQLHGHASDLRSVSQALRDQGKDRPAQLTDRVAGYAEKAGSYLHDKNADAMLSDAEDLGRQKPAAVAAGALAIGFVAARFLKASSSRRYASRETSQHSDAAALAGSPPSEASLASTDPLARPGV